MDHEKNLRITIKLALEAATEGLDPFAATLFKGTEMVASTIDKSILYSDPTAHAELILISEYCRSNKLISLEGFTLYANVEPCLMCSGAIHWSKLDRVVFSVSQSTLKKTSGGNSKPTCKDLLSYGGKRIEVIGPLIEEEGLKVLNSFQWKSKKERHQQYHRKE